MGTGTPPEEARPCEDAPVSSRRVVDTRAFLVLVVVLLGAGWRLWLMPRYAGWEESDYGNLAMIRGVLDGGFRHYDMNHMPGYYAAGAALLALVGDAVVAARAASLLGGLVALGLATWLSDSLGGRRVAWVTGLLLAFQPEFSLYAASSLREPLYAAWVLGMLAALSRERLALAGFLGGMAFLVRMEAVLVLAPLLLLHAVGRRPRGRRCVAALAPLGLAVLGWSAYTAVDHGTWAFWGHSVAVNVETGLGAEAESTGAWLARGLEVSLRLLAWLVPWRIGWGIWLGLLAFLALVPWRRHDLRRTWALLALGMLGVFGGIGLVGQHSPEHNLYWKWLCPIVPVMVPLGVMGGAALLRRLQGSLGAAAVVLAALALLQAGASYAKETRRQLGVSEANYRPQLELARWIEAEVPEATPLLVDNIPACWLDRRHHERELWSWFDVPSEPGDPESFARWLQAEDIGWVLWFREDWTQAPVVAPFLAEGGLWRAGGLGLVETRREDTYGWILFRVVREEGAGGGGSEAP